MSKPPKPAPAKKTAKKAAPKTAASKKAKAPAAAVEPEPKPEPKAKPAAKALAGDPALEKRLSEMTDFQLRAYQESNARISRDIKHAKHAAAKATLILIEKEIARRVATPGTAPSGTRAAVASPKQGKKRNDD